MLVFFTCITELGGIQGCGKLRLNQCCLVKDKARIWTSGVHVLTAVPGCRGTIIEDSQKQTPLC